MSQTLYLPNPKLPWKPKSRRTKSGRWNSHFGRPRCLTSMTHARPGSFGCRVPLAVWEHLETRLERHWILLSWPLLDSQRGVCMCWVHPLTLLGFHPLTCVELFRSAACHASDAGKAFFEHPLTQPGRLRQAKAVAQRDLGVNLPGFVPSSASPSPEPVSQSLSLSASGCVVCSCASHEL